MSLFISQTFKLSLLFSIQTFVFFNNLRFIAENLVLKREKLVAFYTKHIFIAGQTTSQRSEFLNRLIKGFVSLKKDMV